MAVTIISVFQGIPVVVCAFSSFFHNFLQFDVSTIDHGYSCSSSFELIIHQGKLRLRLIFVHLRIADSIFINGEHTVTFR